MRAPRRIWLASCLTIVGCGRIGFDGAVSDEDVVDGSSSLVDATGSSIDASNTIDAAVAPDATTAACAEEVFLASATGILSGGFPFETSAVAITFRPVSAANPIGLGASYGDGYIGSADFRASDDLQFADAMALLSNGSDTAVRIAIQAAKTGTSSSRVFGLSAPLLGTTITMARQRVMLLFLGFDGVSITDFNFEATWELYGCPATS